MSAYYNEFDPKAAAWLRELIKRGLIADGDVDERDLWDVSPADIAQYAQVHLCAGIGVWSYALRRAGWPDDHPVWTEPEHCQHRQSGEVGGLADMPGGGWREERPDTGRRYVGDRAQRFAAGSGAGGSDMRPGPTNGLWRDADWLFCRDGKWRPVEPGAQPLAHGAPARVGRLRGYGNAINAEAATAFIQSYIETQGA